MFKQLRLSLDCIAFPTRYYIRIKFISHFILGCSHAYTQEGNDGVFQKSVAVLPWNLLFNNKFTGNIVTFLKQYTTKEKTQEILLQKIVYVHFLWN
jgi:hypothetical protein